MVKRLFFLLMMTFGSCAWSSNYFQSIQDQWLEDNIFKGKQEGVFVDIKTPDGLEDNKPNFFEKERGWTVILIEPKKDLLKNSPTEILKQRKISHIDYLSIDAEGDEKKILEEILLNAIEVDVISTEINFLDEELYLFLRAKRYLLFKKIGCSEVWVSAIFFGRLIQKDPGFIKKLQESQKSMEDTPSCSLLENASPYIDFLQDFMKENNIRSVVEVGCGDWKVSRYITWGDIQYHGYDVVKGVINQNRKKYGSPFIQFSYADAISTELPEADLMICKDVLQHFPNEDVKSFLGQTSKFKHCLIINDTSYAKNEENENKQISKGGYRPLDLSRQPFKVKGMKIFTYSSGDTTKQVFYINNDPAGQSSSKETKKVLIAILAKNKGHMLPQYLECIDHLDYDKKLIVVYIRTNNNTDNTREILSDWAKLHRSHYHDIIFEDEDIPKELPPSNPHAWTIERWKLLAGIRNRSLEKAKEYQCDYYFVADCDNFILPHTLKYLVHKNKPIIAPMLRAMPQKNDAYSNFFCDVDHKGYCKDDPDYRKILYCSLIGTFKVPLVHCTYLIKTECLDKLNYLDDTDEMEFVVISRLARKNGIDQYICNEREFGTLYHSDNAYMSLAEEIEDYQRGLDP